jgi:CHASE2 domain-containing sensor protein
MYIMQGNEKDDPRKRMLAQQMVTKLGLMLRWPMTPAVREGLTNALFKTDATSDLLYRNKPYQPKTPWTISGILARITLAVQSRLKPKAVFAGDGEEADPASQLTQTHYDVKGSGAVGLVIALLIALFVGMSGILRPVETGLQIGRDAARRHAASGDIVVIAKDDRSAKVFGSLPWPRRYDAQLVDKLRVMGAERIVFNQIMADSFNRTDDEALAAAFDRAGGKVWLGVSQEYDRVTGKLEPILPIKVLRDKSQQAHIWGDIGVFGSIERVSNSLKIGDKTYPSQSAVLAESPNNRDVMRPDFAIDHRTIPTYSASDVVYNRVDHDGISGKTVFVVVTSDLSAPMYTVFPYSRVAGAYSLVIAAEALKAGAVPELGYLLPLLVVLLIGIACVIRRAPRARAAIIIAGALGLVVMMFGGDRLGLHFEMVPALLALSIFAFRENIRSNVMAVMMTNAVTGLPNFAHLRLIKGYQACTVVALKFDRFNERMMALRPAEQRSVTKAIAARINIVAPGCVVHQADDGLFTFLVPPDSEIDTGSVSGQLTALFALDILGIDALHAFDISVGACGDSNRKFESRLEVAIDRAERGIYIMLREVY